MYNYFNNVSLFKFATFICLYLDVISFSLSRAPYVETETTSQPQVYTLQLI